MKFVRDLGVQGTAAPRSINNIIDKTVADQNSTFIRQIHIKNRILLIFVWFGFVHALLTSTESLQMSLFGAEAVDPPSRRLVLKPEISLFIKGKSEN